VRRNGPDLAAHVLCWFPRRYRQGQDLLRFPASRENPRDHGNALSIMSGKQAADTLS
jgi:hypothetical protein